MMRNISYVFPNTSTFNLNGRGGLYKRYEFALKANCNFIEIPADFIKNKTEVKKTGKDLGTILSINEVNELYEPGTPSNKVRYILHTEPSLTRRDGAGNYITPPLCWYDQKWTNDFIGMLTDITDQLPHGISVLHEQFEVYQEFG